MRSKLVLILIGIFAIQIALLVFIFGFHSTGSPGFAATPMPTMPKATMPALTADFKEVSLGKGECQIAALDLAGAWVEAGTPETDPFPFEDVNGKHCQSTFAELHQVMTTPNLWYAGAPSCTTCHTADLENAAANMSLTTYADILAGSYRDPSGSAGQSILGDAGNFESSHLYIAVHTRRMPPGRPVDSPENGPVIRVGEEVESTS